MAAKYPRIKSNDQGEAFFFSKIYNNLIHVCSFGPSNWMVFTDYVCWALLAVIESHSQTLATALAVESREWSIDRFINTSKCRYR